MQKGLAAAAEGSDDEVEDIDFDDEDFEGKVAHSLSSLSL